MKKEFAHLGVMLAVSGVLAGCDDKTYPHHEPAAIPAPPTIPVPPPPAPPATYTLSGTVSGLTGAGLQLGNAGATLPVAADGTFTFSAPVASGASYAVTVTAQPTAPAQVCTVANGSGVANANVGNLAVNCVVTPISLVVSTPADGATNVARATVPALTFSAALDTAAVPGHTTFKRGTHTVPASIAANTDTLTVSPQGPLSLLTTYTIEADSGLSGLLGEPMAAASSVSFTTVDGVWHAPQSAKVNAPNTSDVQVAMGSNGNAIAVWHQYDGANTNIWANTYTVGAGWGTAQEILPTNALDELNPRIAANAQGDAVVVWSKVVGNRTDIWYTRYTAGTGWDNAAQLSAANVGIGNDSPQVAVNATGDAVIAWINNASNDYSVWASYMPAGGTMGAAARIESATGGSGDVRLAIDAAGNATAMWLNFDSTTNSVDLWSNTYSNGSWATAGLVENSNLNVSEYSVAVDGTGTPLAAWSQELTNSSQAVYTSRFDAGAGWTAPVMVGETTNSSAYFPKLAADADGNALVMWGQYDGSTLNSYSSYYTAGGSWGTPVITGMAINSGLAFDASGNALAVCGAEVSFMVRVIEASRFTAANGWSTPVVLTPGSANYAQYPQFAIDAVGGALAVWIDFDLNLNQTNIASARFDDSPVSQ